MFMIFMQLRSPRCRYHATRYNEVSRQRLDIALLTVFQGFRKVYIGEQVVHSSKVSTESHSSVAFFITQHVSCIKAL